MTKKAEEKNKELEVVGKATEGEMNKWKAKYPGKNQIKVFEVIDDGKKHLAYFRKPTLELMQAADAAHADNYVAKNNYLRENCYLGGSEEFSTDDEFSLALDTAVARSFRILVGTVKNA